MAFTAKFTHPDSITAENQAGIAFDENILVKVIGGNVHKSSDNTWHCCGMVKVFYKNLLLRKIGITVENFDHEQPLYPQLYESAKEYAVKINALKNEIVNVPVFEGIENC